jgi:ribosome-binding factor A
MINTKQEKIKNQIKEVAAKFIQKESNGLSLITVTNIQVSKDEKYVSILFTVFPEDKESDAIDFLKRKRSEFRDFIKEETRLARIPMFDFEIDRGEKHRQKIDIISIKSK